VGFLKKLGKGLGKVAKAGIKVGMKGGLSQLAGGPVAGMLTKKVGKRILGGKRKKPTASTAPTSPRVNAGTSSYSNMERQPRKVEPKRNYKNRMQKADGYNTPPTTAPTTPGKRKVTPRYSIRGPGHRSRLK